MQAQQGFETGGMVKTFTKTIRTQGPIGLYRYVYVDLKLIYRLWWMYFYSMLKLQKLN